MTVDIKEAEVFVINKNSIVIGNFISGALKLKKIHTHFAYKDVMP
jgi:hypothetical protein